MTKHPSTWSTFAYFAYYSMALRRGNMSNPPADNSWSYCTTSSVHMTDDYLCGRPIGIEVTAGQFERWEITDKRRHQNPLLANTFTQDDVLMC